MILEKKFYIYIIKSKEGRFYVGSTENLGNRLKKHNQKMSFWTSRFSDWEIIYTEKFKTRKEALCREQIIKSYKGGQAFKKLISN